MKPLDALFLSQLGWHTGGEHKVYLRALEVVREEGERLQREELRATAPIECWAVISNGAVIQCYRDMLNAADHSLTIAGSRIVKLYEK